MKIVMALVFIGIVAALAAAGFFMLRDGRDERSNRGNMARSLAMRVALSIALFVFILAAYKLGWIRPTGLPVVR